MATTNNTTGCLGLEAAADINEFIRVKLDANGKAAIAAAADAAIGVTEHKVLSGGVVTVRLFSAPGSFIITAGGAITRGNQVYPAAAGKIAAAGTTALNLVAKDAAAADGDQIECVPVFKGA